MPAKKEKTKNQKAKRDIFDFIKDATGMKSNMGEEILTDLKKRGMKIEELRLRIINWGYEAVSVEDVKKLVNIYRTRSRVKKSVNDCAY